ncbi:MAG: ABC transporter substrate-binding protein [Pseudorhodoplanes sp.]|uniref:ABC transporter substrate-binding protein n=1 Tax=Pseudorhodoplanes sp. TaxID=1934341 RepID=UPI003D0FA0A8
MRLTRRTALMGAGSMTLTGMWSRPAVAASEVKFALITPLSGPWARGGLMMRQGAEIAIEDINASGGIKAVGGAKVKLLLADAGDSPDKARNAAQRLVAENPDLVGGVGCWLSSFTLAVTEVTERAGIPWLANGFADQVTARGFKNVFQTIVTSTQMSSVIQSTSLSMAKAADRAPKKIALLAENTPAALATAKPLEAGYKASGIDIVVNEVYTPPLSDATPLVQKLRAARPDMLVLLSVAVQDNKTFMDKLREFGLGPTRLPVIILGAQSASPEFLKLVGPNNVEGVMGTFSNWPKPVHGELVERLKKRYNEEWIGQDQISTYGDMWLLKEAAERSGSVDPAKIASTLRQMDERGGIADYYSGGRIKFDDTGKLVEAGMVIIQWQDNKPVLVYPTGTDTVKVRWPKA